MLITSENTIQPQTLARANEPRWPIWYLPLTAWLLPATSARRTQHISLKVAFVVHGVIFVILPILFFAERGWESSYHDPKIKLNEVFNDIIHTFRDSPGEAILNAIIGIGILEGTLFGVAFLLGPWGAVEEPFRATLHNALRSTWLGTTALIPWFFVLMGVTMALFNSYRAKLRERDQLWATAPVPKWMAGDAPGPTDPAERERIISELRQKRYQIDRQWWLSLKWYQRYRSEVFGWSCVVVGACCTWGLLRGIGAERVIPSVVRSPSCEQCGYNLNGVDDAGKCPECGLDIAVSLSPKSRPGVIWEHRHEVGRWRAWWRTIRQAVGAPTAFGGQMRLAGRNTEHRAWMMTHLLLFFPLGYATFIGFCFAAGPPPFLDRSLDRQVITNYLLSNHVLLDDPLATAVWTGSGALVLTFLVAGVIGLWVGIPARRNMLPAAMKSSAYLSPFLLACGIVSSLVGMGLMRATQRGYLDELAGKLHFDVRMIAASLWCLATLLMFEWYLTLLYKSTAASRYANR